MDLQTRLAALLAFRDVAIEAWNDGTMTLLNLDAVTDLNLSHLDAFDRVMSCRDDAAAVILSLTLEIQDARHALKVAELEGLGDLPEPIPPPRFAALSVTA